VVEQHSDCAVGDVEAVGLPVDDISYAHTSGGEALLAPVVRVPVEGEPYPSEIAREEQRAGDSAIPSRSGRSVPAAAWLK
jgi:hypothetical protein